MNEYVAGKVSLPGLLLQIFGALVILGNLLSIVLFFIQYGITLVMFLIAGDMEAFMATLLSVIPSAVTGLGLPIASFIAAIVIIMAGGKLKSTSSAGLVYAGAIFAMMPCCSNYCCCIGAGLGIWVLVTMQDEQVRSAFAEAG